MQFAFTTSYLPDNEQITNNAMTESNILVQLVPGINPIIVSATNWSGITLDTVQLAVSGSATLWGGPSTTPAGNMIWGKSQWGGSAQALANQQLQWSQPLVFDRLQIKAIGQCALGFKIGTVRGRYQQLRTETNIGALAA
jgi:hypothetical protein